MHGCHRCSRRVPRWSAQRRPALNSLRSPGRLLAPGTMPDYPQPATGRRLSWGPPSSSSRPRAGLYALLAAAGPQVLGAAPPTSGDAHCGFHRPHLLRLSVPACLYVRSPPFPLRPTPPMAHPARPRRAARASRVFPASLATGASHRHRGPTDAVALGATAWCATTRDTPQRPRQSSACWEGGGGAQPCFLVGPCLFGSLDTWWPRGAYAACSGGCWRP